MFCAITQVDSEEMRRKSRYQGSFQSVSHASKIGGFDIPSQDSYAGRMECLHAPWRIQYILAPKPSPSDASLFSQIARSDKDITNHVIARERTCYALLNNYPYNGGHLMVVPYKQAADFNELTDEEILDLIKLMRRSMRALKRVMKPEGFNVGVNLGKCAGAGIAEHLHIHVVPRWNGDTNFMPVLGQTSVVPQAMLELAAQLREAISL